MPDKRIYSSINGNLVCGGMHKRPSPGPRSTCIKFDLTSGAWTSAYTLDVGRYKHVSWTPQSGSGTYLMGDYAAQLRTSSLLKPDGTVESGFDLRWSLRFSNIFFSSKYKEVVSSPGEPVPFLTLTQIQWLLQEVASHTSVWQFTMNKDGSEI